MYMYLLKYLNYNINFNNAKECAKLGFLFVIGAVIFKVVLF